MGAPREITSLAAQIVGSAQRALRANRFALYRPVEFQRPWFESKAPIRVIVGGNQIGKRRPQVRSSPSLGASAHHRSHSAVRSRRRGRRARAAGGSTSLQATASPRSAARPSSRSSRTTSRTTWSSGLGRPGRSKPLRVRDRSAEDRQAILQALPNRVTFRDGSYISHQTLLDTYTFWFAVGWRDSELVGLQFTDVDFPKQTIHVQRGRSSRCNPINPEIRGVEDKPKAGERLCELQWAPYLFELIERRRSSAEYLAAGRPAYVFYTSAGQPLSQEILAAKVWGPIMTKLGFSTPETVSTRETAMYSIRHSCIGDMIDAGIPIQIIEDVVGTSREMIVANYLDMKPKLDPNIGRKFLDRLTSTRFATGSASDPEAAEGGSN